MKAVLLAALMAACTPIIIAPNPVPASKGPQVVDDAVVFAEELITRRAVASSCINYYGPVKVRVSIAGEILGICGTL